MFRFLLRRLGMVMPTFLGITILAFALIHLMPGDPVEVMLGERGGDPAYLAKARIVIPRKVGITMPRRRSRNRNMAAEKGGDRKSTRLNSSHQIISYAVFCLK